MPRLALSLGSSFALVLLTGAVPAQPAQAPPPDRAAALQERAGS